MGVSIKNPFYLKKENILQAIQYAINFDEFLIFVVDYPYRLSLQALKNKPLKNDVIQSILQEGEELKRFLLRISKSFNNVKIFSWQELENKKYNTYLIEIKQLEKQNSKFSKSIQDDFTGIVVKRLKKLSTKKELKEKLSLCKQFLIEELAMFLLLISEGYTTRVSKYPRSKSLDYFIQRKNFSINHIQI